jgi:hypothetical protein
MVGTSPADEWTLRFRSREAVAEPAVPVRVSG